MAASAAKEKGRTLKRPAQYALSNTPNSTAQTLRPAQTLLPIFLDFRGTQAREPVTVDRPLPTQILFHGQHVAFAGFLQTQQAAADGGDDFRLAAT
jgi:hypothetical protein